MIIDLILDRRDGIFYNPFDFYIGVVSYAETAPDIAQRIAEAMDGGETVYLRKTPRPKWNCGMKEFPAAQVYETYRAARNAQKGAQP